MQGGPYEHLLTEAQKILLKGTDFQRIKGMSFLCPYNIDSLRIQGSFTSAHYEYVKLELLGCDLGDECFPED